MYDIYENTQSDQWRFSLGKSGSHPLLTIGLNPSTATREKSDTTVAKVERIAKSHGFDGFTMLNLYPIRATDYRELPVAVNQLAYRQNMEAIERIVATQKNAVIWVAWGGSIKARVYFAAAILEMSARLAAYMPTYLHFGPFTQDGHPRHPSRLNYSWCLAPFDMTSYCRFNDCLTLLQSQM